MIVRAIDDNNDWTYGKGLEDYRTNNEAVAQSIKTRLQSFFGDCFFANQEGIDWFNLLGSKSQLPLNLAINATILNTDNVTGIVETSISLSPSRDLLITYIATTSFGVVSSTVILATSNRLLTQSGDILTDQSGNPITI